MTDAPNTPAETPEKQDTTLNARRILIWVVSIALSLPAAASMFFILPAIFGKPFIPLNARLPISFVEIPLLPLCMIPMAFFLLIWLDYFTGTKILPD
ncbi:MAG TPA: hypothetical protein PLD47_11120 [Aggregatilineales bacterium]|nr:hypothetical protein [Anaerolineales bacterium]HRE48267.1 hypothetical protein [Aggregatilineales bacterium]